VLVAHGDQGGGYSMYLDDTGELVAAHNGYGLEREVRGPVVPAGDHELELRITCPGQNRWDLALAIDGEEVASDTGFRLLMAMAPFQGIDVGIDRRSPVSWSMYQRHGSFAFTGTLHHVAYQPGAPAPDSPENFLEMLRDWGRSFE
jgi:arylsulfatase